MSSSRWNSFHHPRKTTYVAGRLGSSNIPPHSTYDGHRDLAQGEIDSGPLMGYFHRQVGPIHDGDGALRHAGSRKSRGSRALAIRTPPGGGPVWHQTKPVVFKERNHVDQRPNKNVMGENEITVVDHALTAALTVTRGLRTQISRSEPQNWAEFHSAGTRAIPTVAIGKG